MADNSRTLDTAPRTATSARGMSACRRGGGDGDRPT